MLYAHPAVEMTPLPAHTCVCMPYVHAHLEDHAVYVTLTPTLTPTLTLTHLQDDAVHVGRTEASPMLL